jgi:DNA recombination-dependent growth factor C
MKGLRLYEQPEQGRSIFRHSSKKSAGVMQFTVPAGKVVQSLIIANRDRTQAVLNATLNIDRIAHVSQC